MTVTPTQVRFCHQTWQLNAKVQYIDRQPNYCDVVTDITPFHPVSHIWPDHPADKGTIVLGTQAYSVTDCLVGAYHSDSATFQVGEQISVKRDTPGWAFLVVHRIEIVDCAIKVGDEVELTVDKPYQQALSRGHSAGHIAYLALNKVLELSFWRKDADRKDTLGHRDFNSYAQQTSFVSADCCIDNYRLGKTLRKRGLNTAEMLEQLPLIENELNQQFKSWVESGTAVNMRCEGECLTDSRYWECDLGTEGKAIIPCGGTHIESLAELGEYQVELKRIDDQTIEMHTHVNGSSH